MLDCGKLSASVQLANCTPSAVGVEPEVILINDADVESYTEADGVVSAMVLKTGASAYRFESLKNGIDTSVSINKGTYVTRFVHQLVFRAFVKSQELKEQLNALANGKVKAIVKNMAKDNENTIYEVFGLQNGLVMTDLQAVSTDADGVVYAVTLASDDNAPEGALPASFFAADLEQTEQAIESLLSAAI